MKRIYAVVDGRVQGVGFRYFCMMQAQKRSITGSVRNMENGMVEIFAQGDSPSLDAFFAAIQQGDRFIRVDEISQKEIPVVPDEREFEYQW